MGTLAAEPDSAGTDLPPWGPVGGQQDTLPRPAKKANWLKELFSLEADKLDEVLETLADGHEWG